MDTSLLNGPQAGSNNGSTQDSISSAFGSGGEVSDLFTKLLVAQIQNQNPLEPTDPSQFVNQLTQLSQMESLQGLTKQSAASTSMLESMQVLALGGQVGSNVMARTDTVTLGEEPIQGVFSLENASAENTLVLTDSDGVKHEVPLGTQKPGEVPFTIDPEELGLAPGTYSVSVKTANKETPVIEVAGKLTSVKLSAAGGVVLNVSNLGTIAPESITQFNGQI